MRGVDLISAIDVSRAQEGVGPRSKVLALVGRGVRAQQRGVRDVVRVAGRAPGVLGRDAQVVEALRARHDGVFGVVHGELVRQRGEVLLDFGANDADGVVGPGVQALAY